MTVITDPDRLAALDASGLLDKDVAGRLNHLAYSATMLTSTDVSQINVLGNLSQTTIAQYPEPLRGPISAESSGCHEVVRLGTTIVIPDTVLHPVTCDLPWVEDFRGYLGTPVHYSGQVIGALCVLTANPRDWHTRDLLTTEGLARLVSLSLEPEE